MLLLFILTTVFLAAVVIAREITGGNQRTDK